MDPVVIVSALSVLLSWYQFYVRGNTETALFVGLWPPTFLAFGSYFKQSEMGDKIDESVSTESESAVDSLARMIENR